jgi:hypothetical protein
VSNSVHSVQSLQQQDQTDRTIEPPKTPQQKIQTEPLQDTITLSGKSPNAPSSQGSQQG